jgi:tRNA C32,U32 (ribose-2'-O)-methylase TrmJ
MKTTFLEHLTKIHMAEEQIVQRISYVLELFLTKTDLTKQEIDEIKGMLKTLTDDSVEHDQTLGKIIGELERGDR